MGVLTRAWSVRYRIARSTSIHHTKAIGPVSLRQRPELVSIIIPVRNGSRHLGLAIHSALAQTWPAVEVIVIDDGSDDGGATHAVIASYDRRIRCIRQAQGGIASALNAGIAAMRGRYFCWLGHDGLYHPEKVERQLAALQGLPSPGIAFSDVAEIDLVGLPLGSRDLTSGFDPRRPLWTVLASATTGSSLLIARACLDRVGIFDPSLTVAFDDELLLRLIEEFPLIAVPGAVVRQRVYSGQEPIPPDWIAERSRVWREWLLRLAPSVMKTHADSELAFLREAQRLLEPAVDNATKAALAQRIAAQEKSDTVAVIWVVDGRGLGPSGLLASALRAELRVAETLCIDTTASGELSHHVRKAIRCANWQYRRLRSNAGPLDIARLAVAETNSPTLLFADAGTPSCPAVLRSRHREILEGSMRVSLGSDDGNRLNYAHLAELGASFMRRNAVEIALAGRVACSTAPAPDVASRLSGVSADDEWREVENEIVSSSLFDSEWYRQQNPAVAKSGIPPLQDYLTAGTARGRNPNPLFDTDWYFFRYPEVSEPAVNPLLHFIRIGAARDYNPHPLFDTKWYRAQYLEGEQEINPLAHYLFVGRRFGFRPNPAFDPAMYVRLYPDALAGNGDPHTHYRRVGARENRLPCTEFDPDFYATQLSDGERAMYRGNLIEHYLRYGRAVGVRADPRARLGTGGAVYGRGKSPDPDRPAVLVVGSADETTYSLRELAAGWRNRVDVLFLSSRPDHVLTLSAEGDRTASLGFDPASQLDELIALLKASRVARLHVHRASRVRCLKELINGLGVPYDLAIHDYCLLAPQPHLVGADGRFVGEELALAEGALCALSEAEEPIWSLRGWRRQHRWLLDGAVRIIAPSHDAARRLRRYYPELPVIVALPDAAFDADDVSAVRLDADDILRVAVLGRFERRNGYQVLLEAARLASRSGAMVRFELIGASIDDDALREAGVAVWGKAEESATTELLSQSRPHLLWFPTQWPEALSDRFVAAIRSGLPLAAADIGALPEWSADRAWCWVRPWQSAAAEWLRFFSEIREQHFLTSRAPEPSAVPERLSDRRYSEVSLDWLEEYNPSLPNPVPISSLSSAGISP